MEYLPEQASTATLRTVRALGRRTLGGERHRYAITAVQYLIKSEVTPWCPLNNTNKLPADIKPRFYMEIHGEKWGGSSDGHSMSLETEGGKERM